MKKEDFQLKLKKLTGVAPDDGLTVKQLKEAIAIVEGMGEAQEKPSKEVKAAKKGRTVIGSLY